MQRSVAVVKSKTVKPNVIKLISGYIDFTTAAFAVMGFLLSRSIIVDSVAPLGIAFFICASKIDKYKIPVFISTLIGILLSFNDFGNVAKYAVCLTIFMALNKKLKLLDSIAKVAFIGAIVLLPISMGQAFFSNRCVYNLLVAGVEAIIMFISIYVFSYGIGLMANVNNRMSVRTEEAISISLLLTFSIMGIGDISLFGISIRTILSTVFILLTSIVGGATMGASSGVIIGVASILNNMTSAIYMGIYSFSGLISGAFNKINKYFCILGYILSWTIIYLYTSGITSNMMQLRDILLGCLIVIVLPERLFNKIEKLIKSNVASNEIVYDYIMRSKNLTNSRLNSIYKTYDDLADTFDKIREKDKVLDQRDIANVIDMIHNDECKSCSMRRMCWESRFNHTYTMIYNILEKIEEKGELSVNDIPKNFRKECMKPESIVKISNHYYKMFVLDYDWSVKFSESRKLIANQIRSISKSIKSLSQDLEGDIMLDIEKEKNIYEQLERYDITVDKVSYLTKSNSEFEISIEKKTCHDGCMCENKIVDIISDLVGENMSVRKIGCHCLGGKCKATFVKSQKYKAVTEVSAMSRDGHILCGDNYTYMEINDGKYMMAISDGMGKGKKAYEESSATIDILEKMIDAKIKDEIVIDTINNMLLLKSSEEMFSTLDLGILDLKRGCLETIKMGACSTYIKREDGEVDLISSSSLPVGILSDVKIDRKNVKVKEGDYVIMVSDGIVDAGRNNNLGDNWLIYFLKNIETTNPKEISNLILDRALELQALQIEDDMTVLVTKICTK
ncbi:stage II sporulation protein E [Clostridioides difficile]